MPYNTTPLSRPESSTGANLLPLARIQKIIQSDDEIEQCSKNAAFAIAIAAEEFIWHLVESSQMVAKATGRGSRKAQSLMYADIANAVARVDNLEFLSDVVPRTVKYKDFVALKEKKKAELASRHANGLNGGQRTLDGHVQEGHEMEGIEGSVYGNGALPVASPGASEHARPGTAGARPSFDAVRDEFISPEGS